MHNFKIINTILVILMILGFAGCSLQDKAQLPEDTIEEFETAYNAMDFNAMLECLDESTASSLTAGMDIFLGITEGLIGFDFGVDAETLINAMPLMQTIFGDYIDYNEYPQIDLVVAETYIKGEQATVHIMELNSGETIVINMKKQDSKWKITLGAVYITRDNAERIIIAGQEEENNDSEIEKKNGILNIEGLDEWLNSAEQSITIDLEKITDILSE